MLLSLVCSCAFSLPSFLYHNMACGCDWEKGKQRHFGGGTTLHFHFSGTPVLHLCTMLHAFTTTSTPFYVRHAVGMGGRKVCFACLGTDGQDCCTAPCALHHRPRTAFAFATCLLFLLSLLFSLSHPSSPLLLSLSSHLDSAFGLSLFLLPSHAYWFIAHIS